MTSKVRLFGPKYPFSDHCGNLKKAVVANSSYLYFVMQNLHHHQNDVRDEKSV